MRAVLGVNAYHADASACLLADGHLIAAAEEERFNRVKHWAGVPIEAIRYCLHEAGISLSGVSSIAINSNSRANLLRRGAYSVSNRPQMRLVVDRLMSRRKRGSIANTIAGLLGESRFSGKTHFVEHHTAHLASAFLVSPFPSAVMLSIDAFGDFASTAWGLGEGNVLHVDGRVHFPHSLGIFYETITHYLGFKRYGDEYKIMGLAPYGRPRFVDHMERIVRLEPKGRFSLALDYFRHHQGEVTFKWDGCEPVAGDYFTEALEALLGPARAPGEGIQQRHKDVAHSAQMMYEKAFFHLLSHLAEHYDSKNLVLGGGCAFNSVANGKVLDRTPFEKTYVQAAAGDAGGALGAALHTWHADAKDSQRFQMDHAYWGPAYSEKQLTAALMRRMSDLGDCGCQWFQAESAMLLQKVAEAIAQGKVIGWFQGRMEWGPRALGNRSILCDPRRGDMKEILNSKIKRRESFRPFAPAILREEVANWFETDEDVPFMMKVLRIRENRRSVIPAVTHVDGTGRLQTVTEAQNPLFHGLIRTFYEMTEVPILLNTSFNENEPIVRDPDEAIDCFLRTEMDILVLGTQVICRNGTETTEDIPSTSTSGSLHGVTDLKVAGEGVETRRLPGAGSDHVP